MVEVGVPAVVRAARLDVRRLGFVVVVIWHFTSIWSNVLFGVMVTSGLPYSHLP